MYGTAMHKDIAWCIVKTVVISDRQMAYKSQGDSKLAGISVGVP